MTVPTAVWPGKPQPLGATWDGEGVNVAVFSEWAERIDVCLFDVRRPNRESARITLPEQTAQRPPRLSPRAWGRERSTASAPTGRTIPIARPALQRQQAPRRPLRPGHLRPGGLRRAGLRLPGGEPAGGPLVRRSRQRPGMPRGIVVDGRFDWEGVESPRIAWPRLIVYEAHVQRLHHAPPRGPRVAARDLRRLRAPGGHRPPQAAGRHRGGAPPGARGGGRGVPRGARGSPTTGATTRSAFFAPDAALRLHRSVQRGERVQGRW